MTDTTAPLRFEIGEQFSLSRASRRGTVIVRQATPYGFGARFRTTSPCCGRGSLIDAAMTAGTPAGELVTCRGCGWKWATYLALDGERLPELPRDAIHPHIRCNQAEWVSRGFGTRPYRKRRT
jgi:hypothetical protein